MTIWYARGAAYVSQAYADLLTPHHSVFVYARGGEVYAKGDPDWDKGNVHWGYRLHGTRVNWPDLCRWLDRNAIEILFFNEQREVDIVAKVRKARPTIKLGAYVDYYSEETLPEFSLYDFLICNTKRHHSAFAWHPQCIYIPWGTDVSLFLPGTSIEQREETVFFHSCGMSPRKGTDLLIDAFISGELYKKSCLIIHSQVSLRSLINWDPDELKQFKIRVIEATVPAPGLYHLGDVYVYPSRLEGIGLTLYEALACGLPVIATDSAPMNEVVNEDVGRLVTVERFVGRKDGYYWPQSICQKRSLVEAMRYFIDRGDSLLEKKVRARDYACKYFNWQDRRQSVLSAFEKTEKIVADPDLVLRRYKIRKKQRIAMGLMELIPDKALSLILASGRGRKAVGRASHYSHPRQL